MSLSRSLGLPVLMLAATCLAAEPGAPAPAKTPAPETRGVKLAIADEPLPQVLAMLEQLTGKVVLADPALPKVKVTFRPPRELTHAEAVIAVESILALNGVAISPVGDKFLKALPSGAPASQGAPELHLESVRDLPPSERVVARLFVLKEGDAPVVAEKIKPLLTTRAVVTVIRESNALLVTDSLTTLIRLEDFIGKFDQPAATWSAELKNARADTVAAKLKTIIAGSYKRRLHGEVAIDAVESANRLSITTEPDNLPLIKELVAMLDAESGVSAKVEVFPLRCAEAGKIAAVIKDLASNKQTAGPPGPPQPVVQAATDERFSPNMSLVADERSNSIVVQGSQEDITKVRKLLGRLDVVLPQVQIEATIIEVTLNEGEVSGLQSLGLGYKSATTGAVGTGIYSFSTGTPVLAASGSPAFSLGGSVDPLALAAALNQSSIKSRVKVLSSPTIVTTHNKKAMINVSQSQPIITGVTSSLQNTGATQSTVSYQDIGIKLEVTPRIGDNGVIQMEIDQSVESVTGTTQIDGNNQPIIGKREATSYVTANDNQMIVLAGLQSTSDNETEGKVWLLGDIPVIKWLFTPETVSHTRSELMVFLKPHVVDIGKAGPAPALKPESLVTRDAEKFIATGQPPSPIKDSWAEKEKRKEDAEAETAKQPPHVIMEGRDAL